MAPSQAGVVMPTSEDLAPQVFEVEVAVIVRITVRNPNAIDRCVNNEDGWRDTLYDLETTNDVLRHWAFNAVMNGREDVRKLEGWADLPPNAVTLDVRRDSFDVLDVRP